MSSCHQFLLLWKASAECFQTLMNCYWQCSSPLYHWIYWTLSKYYAKIERGKPSSFTELHHKHSRHFQGRKDSIWSKGLELMIVKFRGGYLPEYQNCSAQKVLEMYVKKNKQKSIHWQPWCCWTTEWIPMNLLLGIIFYTSVSWSREGTR